MKKLKKKSFEFFIYSFIDYVTAEMQPVNDCLKFFIEFINTNEFLVVSLIFYFYFYLESLPYIKKAFVILYLQIYIYHYFIYFLFGCFFLFITFLINFYFVLYPVTLKIMCLFFIFLIFIVNLIFVILYLYFDHTIDKILINFIAIQIYLICIIFMFYFTYFPILTFENFIYLHDYIKVYIQDKIKV